MSQAITVQVPDGFPVGALFQAIGLCAADHDFVVKADSFTALRIAPARPDKSEIHRDRRSSIPSIVPEKD